MNKLVNQEYLFKVLLAPHITEKATHVEQYGQYVFLILKDATKTDVKSAIELLFKVKVKTVSILITKPKKKRRGKKEGLGKTFKKAYVTLELGYTIDLDHA